MSIHKWAKGEIAKLIFFLLIFASAAIVILTMPRLAIPLGIAYVLYLIVNPLIPRLMKLNLSRPMAIAVVFIGTIFFLTFPIVKVIPMMVNEAENFGKKIGGIERIITTNYEWARNKIKEKTGFEIGDKVLTASLNVGKSATSTLIKVIPNYLASIVEWIFIVPLFLFFFLRDGKHFKAIMLRFIPNAIFERVYYLAYQFNKQLGEYIFAKFIEASIVALIIISGLLIMDVKFSFLLGLFAGITNIIPYVGPIIGAIPAILIGLADYGSSAQFGAIIILYVVANAIDIALVFPILVSKIVNIHPMVVVISVILGSHFFGLIGMVVSIPVVAAIKLILSELYREIYLAQKK